VTDSEHKKMFWMTLPGILTGLASVITALVALLTFTADHSNRNSPSQAQAPQSIVQHTSQFSTTAANPNAADRCQQIVGAWNWFIGVTTVLPDGTLIWKKNAAEFAAVTGTWTCTEPAIPRYIIRWSHGLSDIVSISQDGKSLSGVNQQNGIQIFAARQ